MDVLHGDVLNLLSIVYFTDSRGITSKTSDLLVFDKLRI